MRELSFAILDADDITIAYSEGVFNMVNLLDKPIHHDPHESIKALVRKARKDFPLKFLPSDNPFIEAISKNNIFKVGIGQTNIVFTAARYQPEPTNEPKNTVFVFIWEELDAQIQDGQNKFKRSYNIPS